MASSVMIRYLVLAALATGLVAQDPTLPPGTIEVQGRWRTGDTLAPFWARLRPPSAEFGGHRLLQLVYEPPAPARLGGTHITDCPFLLLDGAARIIAWNERKGHSEAQMQQTAYHVLRDRTPNDQAEIEPIEVRISPAPAWDATVAPLLLALTWTADGRATVPTVDLYGDHPPAAVAWNRTEVSLSGQACRAVAAPTGTLLRLTLVSSGNDLLCIDDRKDLAP